MGLDRSWWDSEHVVERSRFQRSQCWHNDLYTPCLYDTAGIPKTASMSQMSGNAVLSGNLVGHVRGRTALYYPLPLRKITASVMDSISTLTNRMWELNMK